MSLERNDTMYQLAGEYDCKIDAKGRLKLPSGLLKQLGDSSLNFTINRGFETHLMLYPETEWLKKTKEINQKLNIYKTKDRNVLRYFYRGATKVVADGSERILIPKGLMQFAGLEKEVVLFAYQKQIEIWAKNRYEAIISDEPTEFAEMANDVFSDEGEVNRDE